MIYSSFLLTKARNPLLSLVFRSPNFTGPRGPLANHGGRAAVMLLPASARVLAGGTSSPWPPRIGGVPARALHAPRRRLPEFLVLGMLLVPLRRNALLPLLGKT